MTNSNLIAKAEKLEASAADLRQQARQQEANNCECEVKAAVAGQAVKMVGGAVLAATTGIVLPTL